MIILGIVIGIFQVLLYSLILSENDKKAEILPGLYFIREIFDENFDCRIILNKGRNDSHPVNSFGLVADEFSRKLKEAIQEIYNEDKDFIQTDNLKECENCPYSIICHRHT